MIKQATSGLSQGLSARPCFLMRKHLFACNLDFYFIKTKKKIGVTVTHESRSPG